MRPSDLLATPERVLQRIDWEVIRRLDGMFQGDYRTLFYGVGVDFADLRDYQPHDDVRHIDWNVTARMSRPFVRQYVEDRELTAWLLLDRSASMSFGPPERSKALVLAELATTFARLLTRGGNRVGAVLYDNTVERTIPPAGGRSQVLRLAHELLRAAPGHGAMTDLTGLVLAGLHTIKRRSLVLLVSDFISAPGWDGPLALLAERHELLAIRLWDPNEAELPDAGVIVIEDSETGEHLTVDTGDPVLRARFAELAIERRAALGATAARAGVDLHDVSTTEDLVPALLRIAELRRGRSGR